MSARKRIHLVINAAPPTSSAWVTPLKTVCGRLVSGRNVHVSALGSEVNCPDCAVAARPFDDEL